MSDNADGENSTLNPVAPTEGFSRSTNEDLDSLSETENPNVTKSNLAHAPVDPASDSICWLNSEKTMGKRVIRRGNGLYSPRDNSQCELLMSKVSGPSLEGISLDFVLDVPCKIRITECDTALGRALEKILLTVKRAECAVIRIEVRTVEFEEDCGRLMVPTTNEAKMSFEFRLELIAFDSELEIYEMDDRLKLERALRHKDRGVDLYKAGRIYSAFYRFSKALKLMVFCIDQRKDGFESQRRLLTLSCYLNIAACQLQTDRFEFVVRNCEKALEIDASNAKAYYRRGVAYLNLRDYELAKMDFLRAKELKPDDVQIRRQLKLVEDEERKVDVYFAKRMSQMFKQKTNKDS